MAPSTRSGPTETKSGSLPGLFKGLFIKIGSVGGTGEDGESSGSQPSPSSLRSPPLSSASSSTSPSPSSAVKFAKSWNRAASQGLYPGKVPEDLKREISKAVAGLPRDQSRSHHSGPIHMELPRHSSGGSIASLHSRARSARPEAASSSLSRASLPEDRSMPAPREGGDGPSTDRHGAVRERRSASDGAAGHRAPSKLGNVSAPRKSSSCGSTLGDLEELQEDDLQEAIGAPEGEGELWEEIEPPAEFVCPLSMSVMHDPVIVSSGQTYERLFITRWLADGHGTCPRTSQSLDPSTTVPNQVLKMVIAEWCKQNGVPPPTPRSPGLAFAALSRECGATGANTDADAEAEAKADGHAGVPSSFASSKGSEGSMRRTVQRSRLAAERASRAADRARESERRQRALRDPGAYQEASGKAVEAGRGQVFLGAAGGGSGVVSRPQAFRRARKISSLARSTSEGKEAEAEEDADGADSCWEGEEGKGGEGGKGGEEGEGGEGEFRASSEESDEEVRTPSPLGSGYGSSKGDPHGMSAWPGQLAMQGSLFRRIVSKPRHFRSPSAAAAGLLDGAQRREHAQDSRQDSLGRSMRKSSTVDGGSQSSRRGNGRLGWDDAAGGSEKGGDLHVVDIEALVESVRSGAPEDQAAGAALLRVLTRNGFRNARRVVSSGAVGPLVGLLAAEDGPTVEHAATTLLNLVLDERLKGKVGQEAGLVPSLVRVLGAGMPAARANAAAALCCISTLDGMRQRVCDAGAVPRLVDLLRDGSPSAKKDAANALVSLAMSKENRPAIAESGVVEVLCRLILEGVDAVEEQTGAVFAGLVRDPGGRRVLEEEGAIEALAELLEGGATLRSREYAVSALLGLAVNSKACLAAIDKEGLYTSIDVLTRNGSQKAQAKASALLELLRRFDTGDV